MLIAVLATAVLPTTVLAAAKISEEPLTKGSKEIGTYIWTAKKFGSFGDPKADRDLYCASDNDL